MLNRQRRSQGRPGWSIDHRPSKSSLIFLSKNLKDYSLPPWSFDTRYYLVQWSCLLLWRNRSHVRIRHRPFVFLGFVLFFLHITFTGASFPMCKLQRSKTLSAPVAAIPSTRLPPSLPPSRSTAPLPPTRDSLSLKPPSSSGFVSSDQIWTQICLWF